MNTTPRHQLQVKKDQRRGFANTNQEEKGWKNWEKLVSKEFFNFPLLFLAFSSTMGRLGVGERGKQFGISFISSHDIFCICSHGWSWSQQKRSFFFWKIKILVWSKKIEEEMGRETPIQTVFQHTKSINSHFLHEIFCSSRSYPLPSLSN